MKNILIILLSILTVGLFGQSSSYKKVASTTVYSYNGSHALGDTVNKNTTKTYNYYSPTLFNTAQFQVLLDTITGKPKARLYIYQSFDAQNWKYVDSATTITGGLTGITTKSTVFAPYIQLRVKGVDSTQHTVIKQVIGVLKVE